MPQYNTNIFEAKYFKYIYVATKVYVWYNKGVQSNRDPKYCKQMLNKQAKERLHRGVSRRIVGPAVRNHMQNI